MVGSYLLPRNWQLGARFRLVSGNPDTPVAGAVYNASTDRYDPTYGAVNSARDGAFHQLDLRVDKRWVYQRWMLNVYLDIQNVYNRANPEGVQYNFNFRAIQAPAGAASGHHPGHPGGVLMGRHAEHNATTRAGRVDQAAFSLAARRGGERWGPAAAQAQDLPGAAGPAAGVLPQPRASQRGHPHLGGRRVAGDLAQRRLHHPAGADVDPPAGAGAADLFSSVSEDGQENSSLFGLGVEGQVALTGRLALHGGVAWASCNCATNG